MNGVVEMKTGVTSVLDGKLDWEGKKAGNSERRKRQTAWR